MKTKIIALATLCVTAATVSLYPAHKTIGALIAGPPVVPTQLVPFQPVLPLTNTRPSIEVVFVLDTTGSMGGLIEAAKEKIWSIATTMASADTAPEIKIGLVAYRDRGDAYVTRVVDLSSDLDSMYATLMDFQADGGGDGPESVNQALYDAVHHISWSQDPNSYRVVFLVGDAPPHMDYQDDVKYPVTMQAAVERGIVVNTIQCGDYAATGAQWQQIAQLTQGRYFQVDQAGSAVAIATPFDARLASLSQELDKTRLFYGDKAEKAKQREKVRATEKLHAGASLASRARRATFNASASGNTNLLGDHDLAVDVVSGKVDLSAVEAEQLPEPMQTMSLAQKKDLIAHTTARRAELQSQIRELSAQRGNYLDDRVDAAGGANESLDYKVFSAIREQAEEKGLVYDGGPEY